MRTLRSGRARQGAPQDVNGGPRRIDIDDPDDDDVRLWCRELGIAPVELFYAVTAVGPGVHDVKQELARLGGMM
jgi:hypothetical protein